MASIFSLFGTIFIDNEKANKSIEDTSKKADAGGKSVSSSFSSIVKAAGKAGAAVVTAAGAIGAGLYKMASNTAAAADAIDKGSQKVGFSASEYQKWDYVLGQNGDSIESLTTYVTKLTNNLDDAANGSTSAATKFARLGLSVEELQQMSREEMFDTVIKALAGMEDETERAALANDLLGNKSAALAPMLNTGSDAIEALKDQAEELGMVMSDDAIKGGVTFGDMIDTIKRSLAGAVNQLGSSLFPLINKLLNVVIDKMPLITNAITQLTPIISDLADGVLPPLFDLIESILPVLVDLLAQIVPVIAQVIKSVMPVIIKLLEKLLPIIMKLVNAVLPLVLKLIQAILPILDAIMPLLDLIFSVLDAILTPLLQLITDILGPIIELLTPILDLINALLTPLLELVNSIFGGLSDGLFGVLNPLQMFSPILQGVADVMSGAFGYAINNVMTIINTLKNVFQNIIDFVKNVFSGNWKGAWENVKNIFSSIWEGIKDVGRNCLNNLINIFEKGLNGIINFINSITQGVSKIWDWTGIPSIPKIPQVNIPRLRIGLDYVPYDDYPALLHKGERVMRAGENKVYTEQLRQERQNGGSGDNAAATPATVINLTLNIDKFQGSKDDAEEFGDALLERMQEAIDRKQKPF